MPSKFLPLPANTVERLKELPQRVATLEGLIALWLFGSFARDAWTPISAVATVAEAVYRLAPDIHWLRHAGNVDFLKGRGMSDPAIDRDRVIEFLRLISADVQDLREKAQTSQEEYLQTRDVQAIVERR